MAEADLSRIVSLILENPSLVAQIKSLADDTENTAKSEPSEEVATETLITQPATESKKPKAKRTELLRALRPYISDERGRAIETMIGIADALEMIKGG